MGQGLKLNDVMKVRMNKKRRNDLAVVLSEWVSHKYNSAKPNAAFYLSASLWDATKGTRLESSARENIKAMCPEFYNDFLTPAARDND